MFFLKEDSKKRIKEIFNILSIKQILDILIFPVIALISLCAKPFCRNLWIIQENQNEAVDNGYTLFKYLRQNRHDLKAYYVINFKSKDYEKVKELGNVINYRSLKHWIYYLNASRIIVTQKYANPSPALFYVLHVKNIIKNPRVFLRHGIAKDDAKMFYYNRTKFRLFICGARREYEYVKKKFGYPDENVVFTGLARFDNWNVVKNTYNEEKTSKQKLILITPTWRKWILNQNDFDEFMKIYYQLIYNKEFIDIIEKNDMQVQLILHKNMSKFKIASQVLSKNIQIFHNKQVNIQELINKTDLLITDFSSIFFDIAYRKRPIIFYQFDVERYRKEQLQKGYFSYENDGFGDVVKDYKSVINKVKYYIENDFNIENNYLKKMDDFFEIRDINNCKRIIEEIEKI